MDIFGGQTDNLIFGKEITTLHQKYNAFNSEMNISIFPAIISTRNACIALLGSCAEPILGFVQKYNFFDKYTPLLYHVCCTKEKVL